jgi:hypothetical protein
MLTDVGAFVEVTDTHIDANWVVSVLWAIDESISCRTSRDATLSPCCRGVLPSWGSNTLDQADRATPPVPEPRDRRSGNQIALTGLTRTV